MSQCCFVCNTRTGVSIKNAVYLFGSDLTLKSGKSLAEVLSEIVEKEIKEEAAHTQLLCKKCQKAVVDYDSLQVRVKYLKSDLLEQFKKSLPKYNLDYDTYSDALPKLVSNVKKNELKKLVVPASKLHPLPPDFVLRAGKWQAGTINIAPKITNVMTLPSSSTFNLKVTVGSSVLTQSISTNTMAKKTITPLTIDPKLITSKEDTSNVVGTKPDRLPTSQVSSVSVKNSILSYVNTLPKDYLSSAILKVDGDFDVGKMKTEASAEKDLPNDQPMEIDEDCSLAVITKNPQTNTNLDESVAANDAKSGVEYLDLKLLGGSEGQGYVLGKLHILQNDDDADGDADGEEQTIVMNTEDGSIIRVVSGQKLMYGENGELSLVMPDDIDQDDNGESQDSNDESQIELQVSGDEETANAIIAAAQEKGGAFIKVESGEMYRVQSVESKTDDDSGKVDAQSALQMILHEDGQFRCLLCERNVNKVTETDIRSYKNEPIYVGNSEATMQHLKDFHSARLYICRVCGHVERKRSDYIVHFETHASKNAKTVLIDKCKMHECNICKKKYNSRALLTGHMNMHSGSRPYSCHVCRKSFASKYTHQSHLKTHLDRPRPYKCKQCHKSFFTTQNLSQHVKTHSSVKDFICNQCGKAFATQHNLEVHGVVHSGNKPFVCGVCGKAFARRAEVRDHMRIHTGERPFSCDICGASFTQRSNLHSHKRATHLDDKRYHCTQCPKRFKRRRLLDYHIKASHTGERPLKCDVCRATFVYPEHYKKHARIHSGEKPYTCEVCGKSFNSRDNRNTHRFVHSDRKPYECVVCGAGYMRKQLLYHHMNTSGHLAESIVVNQPRVTKFGGNLISSHSVVVESKFDKLPDAIYESCEDSTSGMAEDKANISLVQNNEPTLLTLHNVDGEIKSDGALLDPLQDPLSTQQASGALRLVPIELPDGSSGWVAIDAVD